MTSSTAVPGACGLIVAGLGVVLSVAPAAAGAPAPWRAPVALSRPADALPPGPAIAVGRTGAVAVAWARPLGANGLTSALEVVRRARPAGAFGAPVELDRITGLAGEPAVSVARDGAATVAWLRERRPRVAVVPPTGPPGPVATIPGAGIADDLALAVDERGHATLLFTERELPAASHLRGVWAAERDAGAAGFGMPVLLGPPGSGEPVLAVAPDGRAVAAWIGPDGAAWAAARERGDAWAPAVRVSGPGPARGLGLSIGELGDAALAWFERAPMVALRDRAGAWSAPEAVAPAGPLPPRSRPDVVIDPLGDAVALAWRQGPAPLAVRVAWRSNRARPWRVSPIARPLRNPGDPRLVIGRSGDALVAWTHPLAAGSQIRARRVPRGGPLGPVERVSTGSRGSRLFPALAIGTGGVITAAWVARRPPSVPRATNRNVTATRRLPVV